MPIVTETIDAADALAILLGQLRTMIEGSTHPDAKTFDAEKWLACWVHTAQPGLGASSPVDLIETKAGLRQVQRLLATAQTGAYP